MSVSCQTNSDTTLIRRPQKKKPPRRRLFNTGLCGVDQRFSHVYSRSNRCKIASATAAMSAPITSPSSFAKTAAITCTSSVTITAYRCTRRARFIREHPTCPSTSSRGICEATLSRVAKRKKAPAHDALIPARTHGRRRWTMDDETWRYCVATVPFALKLFFGLYPESCRFRIYMAWSLLLTPPVQRTGDAPTLGTTGDALTLGYAFIAWR